jgi:hypothetical protein
VLGHICGHQKALKSAKKAFCRKWEIMKILFLRILTKVLLSHFIYFDIVFIVTRSPECATILPICQLGAIINMSDIQKARKEGQQLI